jgi:hypothetical protein
MVGMSVLLCTSCCVLLQVLICGNKPKALVAGEYLRCQRFCEGNRYITGKYVESETVIIKRDVGKEIDPWDFLLWPQNIVSRLRLVRCSYTASRLHRLR